MSLKDREKKSQKFDTSGMTEEELLRQQEELFEKAKQKYMALNSTVSPTPEVQSTDEQSS